MNCKSIHTTEFIITSLQPLLKENAYVLPPFVVQTLSVISIPCCGGSSLPPSCMKFSASFSFRAIESVMHAVFELLLDGGALLTLMSND